MTLDQLRVFVAVAERQHVTRAAQALGIAQSAASQALAALEARHGTALFHRVGRGVELSEAGRVFLGEARAVLAQVEAADRLLRDLGGAARGSLIVKASQTIASYWLPRHLVALRRACPELEILVGIGNTAEVARAIDQGEADLGFIEGDIDSGSLVALPVARDQLVIVTHPEDPWIGSPPPGLQALGDHPWVLREAGSGTRSVFEHALIAAGGRLEDLPVALVLPSNEAVRAAVEAGLGATALSASVAAPSLEAGLLRVVPLSLPDRAFRVIHHARRPPSRAATTLLDLIRTRRVATK
ncbi:LysR substrate-binding domain-containing protein [Pararhodospirillum oryzae]|uniref:LysR family transcriptional regulator n=1 Tax=Pararhodospirillum oryzae TaxID=478448 RepID=A0A512H6J9_9PROT|nr:LysR substrate-binding domain-containing protein [Pararhodospirillum oryzae]GEO81048.1 LysR family transcriptional regulator [Pararhodospirillum oryzae]